MRKLVLVMMAFLLMMVVVTPSVIDAKPRGGFKSGTKSYNNTPSKSQNNVNKSDSGSSTKSGTTATGKRGFFSGGSFLGGLMMGGLAGMLFGSMLGSGFMANMFGLLINIAAIFIIFAIVRSLFTYFKNRRKVADSDRHRRY